MIIFTKFSNERDPKFRIRTDIVQEGETRRIRKTAADPEAISHTAGIYDHFVLLQSDLEGSGMRVNPCTREGDAVWFPFCDGPTLEQRLDELLAGKRLDELEEKIAEYFSLFCAEGSDSPGSRLPFSETREFVDVFGRVALPEPQYCRAVSDIDMVFANAIETEGGYELIDYEWTFVFPIPVKYIMYRCLYYYIYGNAKRSVLSGRNLFERFGISPEEQEQFARMERRFQQYILGSYTPIWKLYPAISDGVIEVAPLVEAESLRKRRRTVEVYFDDGRGFGAWNMQLYRIDREGPVVLQLSPPPGTRTVRFDPCTGSCVVRVKDIRQNGVELPWTSNGILAENGDLIFETEDPQILFQPSGNGFAEISFLAEPLTGLSRGLILSQSKKIRWMEQTRTWQTYRKMKGLLGKKDIGENW